MKTLLKFAMVGAALLPRPLVTLPVATVNVVATTPDLASLVHEIGGTEVTVKTLAKPTEDPHFVDAKPSHIVTLNHADVLIDGGAELEIGWLPALLESARNDKIAAGAAGRISASQGVHLMEIPTSFDRSRGDVHALGNPHFFIDPASAKLIVAQIADHLSRVDPKGAATFSANRTKFDATLNTKLADWQKRLAPFKGAKIITYHNDFIYFAERFGLDVVETLEPKPGIAPSPSHLAKVVSTMKAQNAHIILVQPFQNRKTAETVARQTNGVVLDMAQQPGAIKGTDGYFQLMDYMVNTLATALEAKK